VNLRKDHNRSTEREGYGGGKTPKKKKKTKGRVVRERCGGYRHSNRFSKHCAPRKKNGALARASDIPNTHNLAQMVVETRPDNDGRN